LGGLLGPRAHQPSQGSCSPLRGRCPPGPHEGGKYPGAPASRRWNVPSESDTTLLTHTVFDKTRQRPATLVLLRRGMAKGEPTARLARELGMSRKPLHTWRQRVQTNLHSTAPAEVMTGTTVEADERYQNAGEKQHAPSRSQSPATSTRQSAQRPRHLCQRSAPHHQHHLARHGRAALVGGRPRGHADVPYPHRRQPSGWQYAAVHRRMAELPGQSSSPCHRPPWHTRMGAG